eukprot:295064_1
MPRKRQKNKNKQKRNKKHHKKKIKQKIHKTATENRRNYQTNSTNTNGNDLGNTSQQFDTQQIILQSQIIDDRYWPVNSKSKQSINYYKSNVFWSMFPYKYRSGGKCHAFYLDRDLSKIFWCENSPIADKYPQLFTKIKKLKNTQNIDGAISEGLIDELFSVFSGVTLHDFKNWYMFYFESMLESNIEQYDLCSNLSNLVSFLKNAQFGDVIHLNTLPNMNGTYVIGFGDTDYHIIFNHFCNDAVNIDITKYLKLILIPDLFKKKKYRYKGKRNCIPIEFCDAPIHYFSEIPLNVYGFNELRLIDPNRINLNDYNQNIMFKHLNNDVLKVVNGSESTVGIAVEAQYNPNIDDKLYWDKIDMDIKHEKRNANFPSNYFVICDNLNCGTDFCWFDKNDSKWNFEGLGIESWIKRYDDAANAKRLFFENTFKKICPCLCDEAIELVILYLQ